MDSIATELIAKYGPVGVLAIIVAIIAFLMWRMDKRVDSNKVEISKVNTKIASIDTTCLTRKNHFSEIYNSIDGLENKNVENTGEFKVINSELKSINKNVDSIQTDVKTILNHFAEKGMG